jgi:hypothetical protein
VCGINFLPTTCDSITMIMVKNWGGKQHMRCVCFKSPAR